MKERIESLIDRDMTERDEERMLAVSMITTATLVLLAVISFYLLVLK